MTASHPFSWSLTALTVIDIVHSRRLPRREPTTGLTLEDTQTGRREEVPTGAVFLLIGVEPRTYWLRDAVRPANRGFVLTSADVPADAWPVTRVPLPFESSLPGVLAAGDVRHGSVKRVAGAVGTDP